ncbi:MAG: Na+/H+ antiporter subunit G [Gammaproteobacteria bacterium CG11_big_fil_rev_8_21_14_0_20_46_22]|nr:MAG: Na+/H+ antiporter subunit G [Gammaproteobacteria bacterium CG12_big_fil_rev_8_21_14_0_65_46_12]PIR11139.1 MAG: Na+/H+ antiporter subunit G [Gammaproteobacteria bacterium CG11_big_fil_rev_8_21_14_0_20_46_22]
MINLVASIIIFVGSLFCLLAAIGVARMPDILLRMHASTKAGTLGVSLVLLGTALSLKSVGIWLEIVVTIIFLFITGPIAAHVLARAAYIIQVPLSPLTQIDEMREHYTAKKPPLEDEQ